MSEIIQVNERTIINKLFKPVDTRDLVVDPSHLIYRLINYASI